MPQRVIDWRHFGRIKSFFLPALLVVALGVTGTVTYHAYQASRQHRAVVARVLDAYVAFLAQQAKSATHDAVYSCAMWWLYPVLSAPQPHSSQLRVDGQCGTSDGGRFDLDFISGKASSSAGLTPQLLEWLTDTIPAHPSDRTTAEWRIGHLATIIDGRPELISYAVQFRNDEPALAIGFLARGALQHVATKVPELVKLPAELDVRDAVMDYFSIRFLVAGREIASASEPPLFPQEAAVDGKFGGMGIIVGLREAGLQRLAPGGLPRDRGLEFLGLFVLAAGLVVSSLLLLRREAQLARTRASFVAGVSHELRTPLAQIRMFAEMLLLGRVRNESDRRRSLEIIDTEARRLSQLVENVLQVARAENGHARVNPTSMQLAPVVRECVESFSVLAQARSIQFRMELEENLVAPVDSAALRQIVINLLDNAAKYGPAGQRVVVGLALFDEHARLWVDDEGMGIAPRERQRVFDPFYRTRDAQHTTGSGIGLSVVRELVALHGGDVWINDAPDAGTRVVVQFPGAYLSAQQQPAGDIAVA